jgi:threonine synthase
MEQEESIMRKAFALLVTVASLSLFIPPAFSAYDSATVKAAMEKMPQHMTDIQTKLAARDYYGTAEGFMEIARLIKKLDVIVPVKGEKAIWDQDHRNLINAAFKGIGACGAQNDAAIKEAIQELIKYRTEGHKLFK